MKKMLTVLIILTSSLLYAQGADLPVLTGPVVDTVQMLTTDQVKALSDKSLALQNSKGSQIAVCIVSTTAPLTIEQYGIALGEKWKIGRAKIADGIIIIIAKNDRKMRIEVGRGLEGIITDLVAGRIVDNIMAPAFRSGNFYKGIDAAMDALITFINGGDVPEVSAAAASVSNTQNITETPEFDIGIGLIVASIIIFIILAAMGKILASLAVTYILLFIGLYLMGTGLPLETAIIAGFGMMPFAFIAVFMKFGTGGTSSGSSGYSSYSSSSDYSSSSCSSSSDSYSGGGGDFGGGGSSGDW